MQPRAIDVSGKRLGSNPMLAVEKSMANAEKLLLRNFAGLTEDRSKGRDYSSPKWKDIFLMTHCGIICQAKFAIVFIDFILEG